jgi:hypothetical protein
LFFKKEEKIWFLKSFLFLGEAETEGPGVPEKPRQS